MRAKRALKFTFLDEKFIFKGGPPGSIRAPPNFRGGLSPIKSPQIAAPAHCPCYCRQNFPDASTNVHPTFMFLEDITAYHPCHLLSVKT